MCIVRLGTNFCIIDSDKETSCCNIDTYTIKILYFSIENGGISSCCMKIYIYIVTFNHGFSETRNVAILIYSDVVNILAILVKNMDKKLKNTMLVSYFFLVNQRVRNYWII